jgi:hypothetical protein
MLLGCLNPEVSEMLLGSMLVCIVLKSSSDIWKLLHHATASAATVAIQYSSPSYGLGRSVICLTTTCGILYWINILKFKNL